MKLYNECFPCIARGALDTACLATADKNMQRKIVQAVLGELSQVDPGTPPPLMARFIQEQVLAVTVVEDPYAALKAQYNAMALDLYPELNARKEHASDRFDVAVRLAIAGNIIDFGVAATVGKQKVLTTISHALETRVTGDISALKQAVDRAETILWLADNAGEIVFDKLLIAEMPRERITYVVRGGFAQNDATLVDAEKTGLTGMVRVMDSGAAIPGTIVSLCSPAFQQLYHRADLIIAKGQGNFETLDPGDKRIFFLFKAKCPVVARHGNCCTGDVVVLSG
jgi:uncharacterized protein with ATP-grasp and redox domains